jgi:phage baseplate assembly protein gpV
MLSNIGFIDCRYKSVISAESIHLNASTLNIEAGSEVTTSATDRTLDTLDELTGLGTSVNTADVATGGGHASKGGGLYDQTEHTSVREGGKYYGSLYTPNLYRYYLHFLLLLMSDH